MNKDVHVHVILQNRCSGLYFKGASKWTSDAGAAADFHHIRSAIKFAQASRLTHVDAVVKLDDPKHLVHVRATN